MGMVLFEESGIFKPRDFGLNTGDTIQVAMIGGGGGGGIAALSYYQEINFDATAGGASSFANLKTVEGGAGGLIGTASTAKHHKHGGPVVLDTFDRATGSSISSATGLVCGWGADGWMPGEHMPADGLTPSASMLLRTNGYWGQHAYNESGLCYMGRFVLPASSSSRSSESNLPALNTGPNAQNCTFYYSDSSSIYHFAGMGGRGYGAGGGAAGYSRDVSKSGYGGDAGQFALLSHVIDREQYAVTVGAAGRGGYRRTTTTPTKYIPVAGDGAPGCVAIFW